MENQHGAAQHEQLRRIGICALLTAMGVVLGGYLSIPAMPLGVYSLKIGLGVLPVIMAGVLYGPLYGGIVGALTDLLQALIFPKGAYMPWFTLSGALFGLIPGLFFMRAKRRSFARILLAVATGQLIASLLVNTALLVWLSKMPWEIIYARLINQCVMIPLYALITYYAMKLLERAKLA